MKVRPRSGPIWLFVALALLFDFLMPPLMDWVDFLSLEKEIQMVFFFAGGVAGQCCFVALLSGFAKRTWFGAYLFGLGLAAAAYVAVLCGFLLVNELDELDQDFAPGIALLPALSLAAVSPLYILRQFFGWRLVNQGETPSARQPWRLADIFSIVAVTATVLVLVRVPQVISESEGGNYWPQIIIMCLIFFGTSLVVLPIHARVILRDIALLKRLVWLACLAVVIVVVVFGIVQCFFSLDASWEERRDVLPFLLTFLGSAIAVFYLGLSLLAASGMRLVRGCELKHLPASEEGQADISHLQRLTWWRIGGAIAVTMATSGYLVNLERWRAVKDKENAVLSPRAHATGGSLWIDNRIPTNLTLGAKATDEDLAAFASCSQLEYLNLQGSNITDAGLAHLKHFPQLRNLTIKNLPITDEGLLQLINLSQLESLQIEDCPLTASNALRLPNNRQLTSLTLSHTQFGDNECEMLAEFPGLQSLVLTHTRISDRGLAALGRLKSLTTLKLVGTDVSAGKFPFLPVLQNLDLSDTKVNDAAMPSIAKLGALQSLSLRNTKVTNASLSDLSRLTTLYRLDLSDTVIDDEGIRDLGHSTSLCTIDLSCTRVTGIGFTNWQATSGSLDLILDRTLIDDQGVASLRSIGAFGELSLAHTAITDACLQHLAQLAVPELDIRDTKITFNGLINNRLPILGKLHITTGQFTPAQVSQLRKQLGVKVLVESR
jgi:hypothetical protein